MRIWKILIIILFLVVFVQFIGSSFIRLSKGTAQDFKVFYLSAKQVLEGNNPYQKLGQDIIRNPPPAMLFFAPLGLIPIGPSEITYFIASLLAFIYGSFVLFRIIQKQDKRGFWTTWQTKLIYLTLTLRFFPLRHNLASGQVNNFVFLLLTLAFYFDLKKKTFWSAFTLSWSILLKITPAVLILGLLIQKRFKTIIWIGIQLLIWVLLTTISLGPGIWKQYSAITGSYSILNIDHYYNQAITGLLNRISPHLGKIGYFPILVIYSLLFLYFERLLRKKSFPTTVIVWNLGILTMLFFVPFTWQYHLVIAVFPLLMSAYLTTKFNLTDKFWWLIGFCYLLLAWNFKQPSSFKQLHFLGAIILSHSTIGLLLLLVLNFYFLAIEDNKPSLKSLK